MHVISRRPFNDAAKAYPNQRQALDDLYRVLRKSDFAMVSWLITYAQINRKLNISNYLRGKQASERLMKKNSTPA